MLAMPSEAVTNTEYGLFISAVAAMLPVICPVELLMLNPGGKPVAL